MTLASLRKAEILLGCLVMLDACEKSLSGNGGFFLVPRQPRVMGVIRWSRETCNPFSMFYSGTLSREVAKVNTLAVIRRCICTNILSWVGCGLGWQHGQQSID
jgi:hypothetical protein